MNFKISCLESACKNKIKHSGSVDFDFGPIYEILPASICGEQGDQLEIEICQELWGQSA